MKSARRMHNVMQLLTESDIEQLAQLAAGELMIVEDDDGTCWWCPAEPERHSGTVLYTSSSFRDELGEPVTSNRLLMAHRDTPFFVPMVAQIALIGIIDDLANVLIEDGPGLLEDLLNSRQGS